MKNYKDCNIAVKLYRRAYYSPLFIYRLITGLYSEYRTGAFQKENDGIAKNTKEWIRAVYWIKGKSPEDRLAKVKIQSGYASVRIYCRAMYAYDIGNTFSTQEWIDEIQKGDRND